MQVIARFKWSILSALIGLGLNIVSVVFIVGMFGDTGTSFVGPGQTSITITNAGEYTLWYQSKGMIDGQWVASSDTLPSGTTIKVLRLPEGIPIPLRGGGGITMTSGGTKRISIGELMFSAPGQYQVSVEGLPSKHAFHLAEAKFLKEFVKVLVCGLVGAVFLFVGIGSGIYILVKSTKRAPSSAD